MHAKLNFSMPLLFLRQMTQHDADEKLGRKRVQNIDCSPWGEAARQGQILYIK
jgi:hypothetical protein